MKTRFPGFPPEAMTFFRGLARNNNREWFLPRKAIFENSVREPMRQLVEAANGVLAKCAPDYVTDPAKAIFRFYRDTRFSKDKSPYKQHIAASFRHRHLEDGAGFYFAVSHKVVEIGGGIYMPLPETLRAVRANIAEHHAEFRKLLASKAVAAQGGMQGEQLTRTPKGFAPGHPAEDLLRYKQFLLFVELQPEVAAGSAIEDEVATRFRAMTPFIEFLNAGLPRRKQRSTFSLE